MVHDATVQSIPHSSDLLAENTFQEVLRRLVHGLDPEQIYLFGSQARSEAGELSDVDLLVILSDSELPPRTRETLAYDLLWGITMPVDVIVLTRSEFQRGQHVKTSLPHTVLTKGMLLYDRSQN